MRSQPLEYVGGINEPACSHIRLRLSERRVQGGPVGVVQPIARVQRQELQFGTFRQSGRFIDYEPASAHPGLDRHGGSVAPDMPPNKRLHSTAAAVGSGQFDVTDCGRRR
jgi:hypothetical protein